MEVLEYFVNKCCGNVSLLSKVKQNHLQTIKARVFIRGDEPAKSANITTMKGAAVPPVLWKPASPCSAPLCQQPWCLSQLGLTFCLCQQPTLPLCFTLLAKTTAWGAQSSLHFAWVTL